MEGKASHLLQWIFEVYLDDDASRTAEVRKRFVQDRQCQVIRTLSERNRMCAIRTAGSEPDLLIGNKLRQTQETSSAGCGISVRSPSRRCTNSQLLFWAFWSEVDT